MRFTLLFGYLGLLCAAAPSPEQNVEAIKARKLQDDLRDRVRHEYLEAENFNRKSGKSSAEAESNYWIDEARGSLKHQLEKTLNKNIAKNVIIYLGDGMSIPTLMAARVYRGQLQKKPGEESQLYWETFPYTGFAKTWCLDSQVADSACTGTAYMTGVKTNYGTIGINGHVIRGDCETQLNRTSHVDSILKWAIDSGKSAGVVTTTRVTHASPAAGYAHVAERNWESDSDVIEAGKDPTRCLDIAKQLVTQEPGRSLNVVLGGGRREFRGRRTLDEEGMPGARKDGEDLIEEWKREKAERGGRYLYSWNRTSLLDAIANPDRYDYILGLYEASHMGYHLEALDEPTLPEMTEAAIKLLARNSRGFVLFVEGGLIDHAHHDAFAKLALDETIELAEAVKVGRELTGTDDTLIIVTSDHAHTMTVSGYPKRGNSIIGKSGRVGSDKLAYMTLNYANGPGYVRAGEGGDRHDISEDDTDELRYKYPGLVPLTSETHGGDDVAIFASGPWSHLFTGTIEQSSIPHFLAYASCIRPDSACDEAHRELMKLEPKNSR